MKSIPYALGLALLVAAPSALAQDNAPPELQVFRTGDSAMTCVQIADEAAELSQTFGSDRPNVFGRFMGVARTGVAMVVPGAGLAMAGADALTADDRARKAAREAAVEQRWYYLNGLYTGQRCDQQAESASAEPPAVEVSPQ